MGAPLISGHLDSRLGSYSSLIEYIDFDARSSRSRSAPASFQGKLIKILHSIESGP